MKKPWSLVGQHWVWKDHVEQMSFTKDPLSTDFVHEEIIVDENLYYMKIVDQYWVEKTMVNQYWF